MAEVSLVLLISCIDEKLFNFVRMIFSHTFRHITLFSIGIVLHSEMIRVNNLAQCYGDAYHSGKVVIKGAYNSAKT